MAFSVQFGCGEAAGLSVPPRGSSSSGLRSGSLACGAGAAERSLVLRNWLIGRYIVEYEQQRSDRAEYGAQTLKNLSEALRSRIGRGFSVDALERMRRFYLLHEQILAEVPKETKSATLSRISGAQPISETALRI